MTSKPRFRDIPTFPHSSYHADIPWDYLEQHLLSQQSYRKGDGMAALDIDPDFQRGHVWTEAQQTAYVEYILQGGTSGKELYFNCAGWGRDYRGPYVIVDGKQWMQAVRQFMANKIPAFGYLLSQYEDSPRITTARLSWNVAALDTRAEVLAWYLAFNAAGTAHTAEELERVKSLLNVEMKTADKLRTLTPRKEII